MALVKSIKVLRNENVISSIDILKNADDVAIFEIWTDASFVDYNGTVDDDTALFVAGMNLAEVQFEMDEDDKYFTFVKVEKLNKSFRLFIINYDSNENVFEIYSR